MRTIPEKESLTIEFKSDRSGYSDADLVDDIVGMANYGPGNQIVCFQLLQVLAECFICNLLQIALHFVEPDGLIFHQAVENYRLTLQSWRH